MSEEQQQQQYSPSNGSSTEGNGLLLNRCTESELLSLIDVSERSGGEREATLEWEKRLLEEQLKVSRLETQKAQVETEKAKMEAEKSKMETEKAKMETINVGLQAELKMMMFQQQEQLKMGVDKEGESSTNNSSKLEQRIADLEAEMAKQNGQLRESLQVVKELKKENCQLAAKFAHNKGEVANNAKAQPRKEPLVQFPANRWKLTYDWSIGVTGLMARNYNDAKNGQVYYCNNWTTIHAEYPFQISTSTVCTNYFEVNIKEMSAHPDHLACMEFGVNGRGSQSHNSQNAFSVDVFGNFWALGHKLEAQKREGFGKGDTIGCGVRISPAAGRRHIFFTKNGELMGPPFLLGANEVKGRLLPTISALLSANITVEANFGTDLAKTPFKFALASLE